MRTLYISLDDGPLSRVHESVRLVYTDEEAADATPDCQLQIKATPEGLVTDAVEDGEVVGTRCEEPADIYEALASRAVTGLLERAQLLVKDDKYVLDALARSAPLPLEMEGVRERRITAAGEWLRDYEAWLASRSQS